MLVIGSIWRDFNQPYADNKRALVIKAKGQGDYYGQSSDGDGKFVMYRNTIICLEKT
jgi:hypothetical protein